MSDRPVKRNHSWAELERVNQHGLTVADFLVGAPDDQLAPRVTKVVFPPGARVSAHSHDETYAEIILEGAQRVSGRWYRAGDIRVVPADTVYGPLITGPDGATVLIVFRASRATIQPVRDAVTVDYP